MDLVVAVPEIGRRIIQIKYLNRARTLSQRFDEEMASKIPTTLTFVVAWWVRVTQKRSVLVGELCSLDLVASCSRE